MVDIDLVELSVVDLTGRIVEAVTGMYGSALAAQLAIELFDAGSVAFEAHKIADITQPIIAARETLRGYLWQYEQDALSECDESEDATEAPSDEDQNAESLANAGCACISV